MWPGYHYPTKTGAYYYPSYEAYRGWQRRGDSSSNLPAMKPGATWIERGSDGRPYFVRKKTKLPSPSEIFSTALIPWRKSSPPFSSAFKRENHILPAPVSTPLALSPAPPAVSARDSGPSPVPLLPPSHQSSPPVNMYQLPTQPPYSQPLQDRSENKPNEQNRLLRPPLQYYSAPHPNMYPIPPPIPIMSAQLPHPATARDAFHPHGVYPGPSLPVGSRALSPPRFPTADDLKYKCRVCGRFRSTAYHIRHPVPPGELPAETICRKCRDNATDSDDYSSDDRVSRRKIDGARSRSRSRSRALVLSSPGTGHRGRSRSRLAVRRRSLSRDPDWHDRRYVRSFSRSSSLDVGPLRFSIDDELPRRRRSPSVEIVERVRYIDDPPTRRPAYVEETIYIEEDDRGRRRRVYEDEYYDANLDYDYPRARLISRPSILVPRAVRRYSNPLLPGPYEVERREYYDGPNTSVIEERRQLARLPAPRRDSSVVSRPSRSDEELHRRARSRSSHRDDNPRDWDLARDGSRQRCRSRSRQSSFTEDGFRETSYPSSWLSRAPAPPPAHRSSSLGYLEPRGTPHGQEKAGVTRRSQYDGAPQRGRLATVTCRRSRSRSRSVVDARSAESFLRPGDNITVIERQRARSPVEDYDWYDKDGMRVRVREI